MMTKEQRDAFMQREFPDIHAAYLTYKKHHTDALAELEALVGGQPQTLQAPSGTTHIQVVNGKVQFVQLYATTLANIWTDGRWSECCSIDKLPGTIVRLSDGYVSASANNRAVMDAVSEGLVQPVSGPPEWVEHDGHMLTMPNNAEQVYYCFRSDPKTVRGPHAASQLLWGHKGSGGDIVRWRYAR